MLAKLRDVMAHYKIIGMAADLGKIISILAVVSVKAPGLAGIIITLIPVLFLFTRVVQKRMLRAQMDSRAAAASVSGFLPETLHWFQGGPDGAVVSEFSTHSTDETDEFTDARLVRAPQIDD